MRSESDLDTSQDNDISPSPGDGGAMPCVLGFNAVDPIGGGGLASDALVIGSMGAHALGVTTGVYLRDTRETTDFADIGDHVVAEQARLAAEDVPIHVIKAGFLGSAEAVAAVAAFASDYADTPLVAYMPDLSWWSESAIDHYLDAFRELLLPQTAILVGNNATLRHWLLPESTLERYPRAVDLARAAAAHGVSYVLVTGLPIGADQIGSVLASPQGELLSQSFERIDVAFLGAGDILSAALAALLATGSDLAEAAAEALVYLDQALDHGFRPGMGRAVADRLFWAESGDDPTDSRGDAADPDPTIDIPHPFNDTRH